MAVSIMPCTLMAVVATGRHQCIQDTGNILYKSVLKLNRTDRSGTSDIEDMNRTCCDSRIGDNAVHLSIKLPHFTVPACLKRNFLLEDHSAAPFTWIEFQGDS